MSHPTDLCACGSGEKYEACCKPYHMGKLPDNALKLMRSRYTAYTMNMPDYIIATTHPASPQYSENFFAWKRSISRFVKESVFNKLQILDFSEKDTLATVTFTAYITQEDHDATYTERSYFEKKGQQWLYRGGQLAQGHAPNLVTTGQLRLLPLAYYGDSILRKKTDPIAEIDDNIRRLVEEMVETMDACCGIGLAAPQVHHSIRLFVIRTPIVTEDDDIEPGEVQVFINPTLSAPSAETWEETEGCLSLPTLRSKVVRPKEVTIDYTTLHGEPIKRRVAGWEARVIMHEYDHIDGTLFVDRLPTEEKEKLALPLHNLEKRIHDGKAL